MFNKYTYIAPEHHVALEACIRNHEIVGSQLLAELYRIAAANLEKPQTAAGKQTSHLKSESVTVGTATDSKTGFYVQLAKVAGQERCLLTVGAKWAVEQNNPLQGNVATQLW